MNISDATNPRIYIYMYIYIYVYIYIFVSTGFHLLKWWSELGFHKLRVEQVFQEDWVEPYLNHDHLSYTAVFRRPCCLVVYDHKPSCDLFFIIQLKGLEISRMKQLRKKRSKPTNLKPTKLPWMRKWWEWLSNKQRVNAPKKNRLWWHPGQGELSRIDLQCQETAETEDITMK